MPVQFPSPEWVSQLQTEINRSPAYASSAKTWEGDFYFVVEPGDGLTETVSVYIDLWRGECRTAYIVGDASEKKPEFVISGSIETYRKIFAKKLDPIQSLMSRQLKLQGNMAKIMRATKATLDLVNCAAAAGA